MDVFTYYTITCLLIQPILQVVGHTSVAQPTFLSSSNDLQVIENSTVWLPCSVENLGENVVRWWRGDMLLGDSSDHTHPTPDHMRLWANNTLEISSAQKEDSAQYTCQIVRKEPWNPLQLSHQLRILYPPQIFAQPKSGVADVRLGQAVELACPASGNPTPTVTWKTQNKDIENNNEKAHVLILNANAPKIAQTYTCIADNGIQPPAQASIKVNVFYKPIVIADVSWMHAAPGLHAELVCRVVAEPTGKVQWFIGQELADDESPRIISYVQGQQHVLRFRNLTAQDFGIYTCRATNSEGISEATVELSGRARPATFKREMSRWNNSVMLIWEVDSYSPIVDYTLKFRQVPAADDGQWVSITVPADGMNPGPIHTKSFTLSGLESASTYEVVVSSRNRYGLSAPSPPFLFSTQGAEYLINGSSEEDGDSSEENKQNIVENEVNPSLEELILSNSCCYTCNTPKVFILLLTVIATHLYTKYT